MKHFFVFSCFLILLSSNYALGQDGNSVSQAEKFFETRDFKQARKYYERALKKDKKSIPILTALCEVELNLEDWGNLKDRSNDILKIKPDDTAANYYDGIAHRETGKFKASLLRKRDFDKSESYFEAAIQSDSLYKDVFLQRGLLERRRKKWQSAILYGQRQVAVKPDMTAGQVGLFKLYRLYLMNGNKNNMVNWFQSLKNDWADYATGEFLRRYGDIEFAAKVFQAMLNANLSISRVPVYLSLVRLNTQLGQLQQAHDYYFKAVESVHSKTDAAFLFEDVKYILTIDEIDQFEGLLQVEQFRQFFEQIWLKRELIPAASVSYRILEHYRRLMFAEMQFWYDGIRSRINNPDKYGNLDFPDSYKMNDEFNDKGLIFIRHGKPNDVARTSGVNTLLNESWLYYRREDRDKLIFHFLVSEHSVGNNWRLSSAIEDRGMLADRLGWDKSIQNLYYASSDIDFYSNLNKMAARSMGDVKVAMNSDYHTWPEEVMPLSSHYHFAYFKADSEKTEARVYIGLPLNEENNGLITDTLKIEIGSAIVNNNYNNRHKYSDSTRLVADAKEIYSENYLKNYSFNVSPGGYNLSYFIKCGNRLGGENLPAEVPAFGPTKFAMSSIVPAYWIDRADHASGEVSSISITPNPSKEFKLTDPVFLYYELYNMSQNDAGETDYTIESELSEKEKKRGVKNLFGLLGLGSGKVVSLTDKRTGKSKHSRESISFDVSNLKTGAYELEIKVTDNISKKSVLESIPIFLK